MDVTSLRDIMLILSFNTTVSSSQFNSLVSEREVIEIGKVL